MLAYNGNPVASERFTLESEGYDGSANMFATQWTKRKSVAENSLNTMQYGSIVYVIRKNSSRSFVYEVVGAIRPEELEKEKQNIEDYNRQLIISEGVQGFSAPNGGIYGLYGANGQKQPSTDSVVNKNRRTGDSINELGEPADKVQQLGQGDGRHDNEQGFRDSKLQRTLKIN